MAPLSNAVHIKSAVLISPSETTPSRVLPLSLLDSQLFLRFTFEYLLLYNPSPPLDRPLLVSRFKSALSQTLTTFFPLSGRVRPGPDPARLEVDCDGQGAVFVEADSTYTLGDLDRAPRFVDEFRGLLCLHVDDVLCGDPPLVVQLTWLSDGAVALGVGFNHAICDGIGSVMFLNSLARSTRGALRADPVVPVWDRHLFDFNPKSIDIVTDVSGFEPGSTRGLLRSKPVVPVWDRHLIDPEPKLMNLGVCDSHPEFNRVPDISGFVEMFEAGVVPTSNIFTKKQVREMKRRAGPARTAFEVVAAHVWACWVKSLRLPPQQILKLLFSVNVRNRVGKPGTGPGLPAGFYGNGFVLGCVKATAKEVAERGVRHVAGLIAKAKERVDDGYVREVAELVGRARACPDPVGVLVLSQWSKLGLDGVDFFGLGKAVSVSAVCCDRYGLLLPARGGGAAVKVMVALPRGAVEGYKGLMEKGPVF